MDAVAKRWDDVKCKHIITKAPRGHMSKVWFHSIVVATELAPAPNLKDQIGAERLRVPTDGEGRPFRGSDGPRVSGTELERNAIAGRRTAKAVRSGGD